MEVLLVDDQALTIQAYAASVRRTFGGARVYTALDLPEALQIASGHPLDLVLLDLSLPSCTGIDTLMRFHTAYPAVPVLVVSANEDRERIKACLEAGARGYISKDAVTEELVRAVRVVADGKRYICQGLTQNLLDPQKGARKGDYAAEVLTTAELNILKLVVEGMSNPAIAVTIGLSPRTVETYRLRLMRKLGIENLPSLVRYAIRHGIIPLE